MSKFKLVTADMGMIPADTKRLEIQCNGIKTLDGIEKCADLQSLILKGEQLVDIRSIQHCIKLAAVIIEDTSIEDASVLQQLQLRQLILNKNYQLKVFPDLRNTQLREIEARCCAFEEINPIFIPNSCEKLNFSGNMISNQPDFSQAQNIKKIDFFLNPIEQFHAGLFPPHLLSLTFGSENLNNELLSAALAQVVMLPELEQLDICLRESKITKLLPLLILQHAQSLQRLALHIDSGIVDTNQFLFLKNLKCLDFFQINSKGFQEKDEHWLDKIAFAVQDKARVLINGMEQKMRIVEHNPFVKTIEDMIDEQFFEDNQTEIELVNVQVFELRKANQQAQIKIDGIKQQSQQLEKENELIVSILSQFMGE